MPELKDAQIMRLVGTTKTTIASIRDRTHWNTAQLTPMDPVTLGLCSQIDLDFEVQRAAKEKPAQVAYGGATLLPASETTQEDRGRGADPADEIFRRDRRRGGVRKAQAARRRQARRGIEISFSLRI